MERTYLLIALAVAVVVIAVAVYMMYRGGTPPVKATLTGVHYAGCDGNYVFDHKKPDGTLFFKADEPLAPKQDAGRFIQVDPDGTYHCKKVQKGDDPYAPSGGFYSSDDPNSSSEFKFDSSQL